MLSNLPFYYPFKSVFVKKSPHGDLCTLRTFRFTTPKKNIYIVRIEEYKLHTFMLKFHLAKHKNNKYKYNITTNFNETRGILYTCIAIMHSILIDSKLASFGFIGAQTIFTDTDSIHRVKLKRCKEYIKVQNTIKEPMQNNSRFRVYQGIVSYFVREVNFVHLVDENNSAYILLNKAHQLELPNLEDLVSEMFERNFAPLGV